MRRLFVLCCLVFFGLVVWRLGSRLSVDAVGMAVGLLCGVLAGIPTALLVLVSERRGRADGRLSTRMPDRDVWRGNSGQSPVIILAAPGYGSYGGPNYGADARGAPLPALPGPQGAVDVRDFRVVGERDEEIEEW